MPDKISRSRSQAYIEGAAQSEVKRTLVFLEHLDEVVVSRVDEQRNAELFDAIVERLKAWMIDPAVLANRAGNIDADQTELVDRAVEFVDGRLGVLQRHHAARPHAPRVFALCGGHLVVIHLRISDAVGEGYFGEERRERTKRADKIDLVSGRVHVAQVVVEIEPNIAAPPADTDISVGRIKIVAAGGVTFGPRISLFALAQILENGTR